MLLFTQIFLLLILTAKIYSVQMMLLRIQGLIA